MIIPSKAALTSPAVGKSRLPYFGRRARMRFIEKWPPASNMKYPFGSEPNTLVVFPVLSFSFTNELTLQVPTSCCLSGSAARVDNVPHVRAAAIGIDDSAFMVLPPVFRHVLFMTVWAGLSA